MPMIDVYARPNTFPDPQRLARDPAEAARAETARRSGGGA